MDNYQTFRKWRPVSMIVTILLAIALYVSIQLMGDIVYVLLEGDLHFVSYEEAVSDFVPTTQYEDTDMRTYLGNRIALTKKGIVFGSNEVWRVMNAYRDAGGKITRYNRNGIGDYFVSSYLREPRMGLLGFSFVIGFLGCFVYSMAPRTGKAVMGSMNPYLVGKIHPRKGTRAVVAAKNEPLKNAVPNANGRNSQGVSIKPTAVKRIIFDDIAGYKTTKENLQFIVRCLKDKAILDKAGAKVSSAFLLYGEPGNGKTFFAKAIAGTAGVPFYSVNASSFINTYVGVGAAEVRKLYETARANAPCIVFIDEIDAIGRKRAINDNEEFRNTLNALLAELDGMTSTGDVITIAATNKLDSLDEALVRPGRFDRKIYIPKPNLDDREAILGLYAKNKKIRGISIREIAESTEGFSGAALSTLLNESAIRATREGRCEITKDDITKTIFEMLSSSEEDGVVSDSDRMLVSYHEAGHALVFKLLCGKTIPRVSIHTSTVGNLGATVNSGGEDSLKTRKSLEYEIMAVYGGRASEEIFLGSSENVTVGASEDIRQASLLIKQYLEKFGFGTDSILNTEAFLGTSSNSSGQLQEAQVLAKRLYSEAVSYLSEHRNLLDEIACELCDKTSLGDRELNEIIARIRG